MEPYAKVGRGGAGNYYSQHDIQEATARLKEDVEAQQDTTQSQKVDPDASKLEYAHAGRGGAGNFKPTATQAAAATPGDLSTERTIIEGGYAGRGGAGNFRGDAERRKAEAMARERETEEKAYEETVKDVEQGLKAPEKAHLSSEKLSEQ